MKERLEIEGVAAFSDEAFKIAAKLWDRQQRIEELGREARQVIGALASALANDKKEVSQALATLCARWAGQPHCQQAALNHLKKIAWRLGSAAEEKGGKTERKAKINEWAAEVDGGRTFIDWLKLRLERLGTIDPRGASDVSSPGRGSTRNNDLVGPTGIGKLWPSVGTDKNPLPSPPRTSVDETAHDLLIALAEAVSALETEPSPGGARNG